MRRTLLRAALALLVLVVAGAAVRTIMVRPRLTEQQVREAVFTTIQRESSEAFLITGRLDLMATAQIENSRVLLPGLLALDLGTARATVRIPGRVSYGFRADSLRPAMVRFTESGAIEVELPTLEIYSVEPDLTALEVETERGWARLPGAEDEAERRAIAIIEGALRRQGEAHLQASHQPRINTAQALEDLLSPALRGLGMTDPVFRVRLGDGLIMERSG